MRKTLHGRRRDPNRDSISRTKQRDGGIDDGNIAQDTGPDTVLGVGGRIFKDGRAGVGAFIVVITGLFGHAEGGVLLEFGDGEAVEVVGLFVGHSWVRGVLWGRSGEDVREGMDFLECPMALWRLAKLGSWSYIMDGFGEVEAGFWRGTNPLNSTLTRILKPGGSSGVYGAKNDSLGAMISAILDATIEEYLAPI